MAPMSTTRGLVTILVSIILLAIPRLVRAEEGITPQELAALSPVDRVAVMRAFIERRVEKVQNIDVTSETRTYIHRFANGRVGDRIYVGGWFEYRTLYCDGSYRVKASFFVKPGDKAPDSTAISHFDQKTGVIVCMAPKSGGKGTQGRIGHDHLNSMSSNRAAFHLLPGSYVIDSGCNKCEFLLESLASCSKSWDVQVDTKRQQAIITHPHHIAFWEGGTCTRKVYFDITKGMLPVRIELDWNDDWPASSNSQARKHVWREERITMDEPKNFNGFWMATRIEERIRTDHGADQCSFFLTKVNQVVFGQVKEADLQITFPPDTQVVDTIKNVWYHTGPDGEPKGAINPVGIPKDLPITLDAEGRLVQKPSWMLRYGIWLLGIAVALLGAIVVVRKRLRGPS